jgi:secreted PhoX family phosphatase
VADSSNNRVFEFEPPFENGMNASKVIGQSDFVSQALYLYSDRNAGPDNLGEPRGMAFDESGNLWVADQVYNRVLEFVPPFTNGMNASRVVGEPNFTTGMCPYHLDLGSPIFNCGATDVGAALLRRVAAVSFDNSGNLWVADLGAQSQMGRILEFTPPFRNGMNASLVIESQRFLRGILTFDSSGNPWSATEVVFYVGFDRWIDASYVLE